MHVFRTTAPTRPSGDGRGSRVAIGPELVATGGTTSAGRARVGVTA